MKDWTSGYVTDVGYTYGYYSELNPLRIKLAFLNAGLVAPEIGHACELGFGQGISTNMHAAASIVSWYGNDFNPGQTSHARELAAASMAHVELVDDNFADFADRPDLPEFDYICLHGIWSWISDENREHIVEFIRKKLKVGGVVYISYNTLPGWGAFAPVRYLMTEHAELIGADGQGIVGRIDEALAFTEKLMASNPGYARANPMVAERIQKLKQQNRHYLAHEYFNRDWQPMRFSSVLEWLAPAKLSFACSANYLDHIDELNLSAEQKELLQSLPDAQFRETVRDFMVNQQFRRDYWVKGKRKLLPLQQLNQLHELECVLLVHPEEISLKFAGSQGEVSMNESVYKPIIEVLSDYKPRTLLSLHKQVEDQGVSFAHLVQAVVLLTGLGYVAPVQNEETTARASESAHRLNSMIMESARNGGEIHNLASPLLGGAVAVDRLSQLFLAAYRDGQKTVKGMAASAWENLDALGLSLMKDGVSLEGAEANLAEMQKYAKEFNRIKLPVMKALQVI